MLGNNQLNGSLPTWNGGFQKLQLLGLSTNSLTGGLPSSWSFPNLLTLEVSPSGQDLAHANLWQRRWVVHAARGCSKSC